MRMIQTAICLIGSIVLLFIVYCAIPTLHYLFLKRPPYSYTVKDKKVMLSFDDGPDPRYTEKLLQILKNNGISAVFFLVAEKAAEHPEIVKKICESGHIIGLHSLEHRDTWLVSPGYQKADFTKSLDKLKKLGCEIKYYRAPWGHLNITSLFLTKNYGLKIVLWTVMAQDWRKGSTPQIILDRLKRRSKNGSVICLHDSGCGKGAAPAAPENTLEAVSEFVPFMLKRGFSFVLPDETQGENKAI